ncbi:MAG: hypothetical protein KDD48_01005 [Bdellovibrionales bacterium]|nr:hypothetical protein [Bdellovibrionales bacterium]
MAEKEPEESCPHVEGTITTPASVDPSDVLIAISHLKNLDDVNVIELNETVITRIHEVFNTSIIKTKMEQFYTLLYVLARAIPDGLGKTIKLRPEGVIKVLLASRVFSDPDIPKHISLTTISRHHATEPRYTIAFDQNKTEIPLNKDKGFHLYRNGLCQHARKLIFGKEFSVAVKTNGRGHLVASDFRGVDLFGRFGSRGLFDVDINFVALRSVEFFKGTPNGKVTAYVSRQEFKKNDHNPLLQFFTKYIPDRSVQPIDW